MEVFTSEGKGRGLKATKEFWAADVIFAERAYSAVVFDRYVTGGVPLPDHAGLKCFAFKIIRERDGIHVTLLKRVVLLTGHSCVV